MCYDYYDFLLRFRTDFCLSCRKLYVVLGVIGVLSLSVVGLQVWITFEDPIPRESMSLASTPDAKALSEKDNSL